MKNSSLAHKERQKLFLIILAIFLCVFIATFLIFFLLKNAHNSQNVADNENTGFITDDNLVDYETVEAPAFGTTTTTDENISTPLDCSYNFTTDWGPLMLINPNFTVSSDWIAKRKTELVNITELYNIREGLAGNGIPLLDAEAAEHLNTMLLAYESAYPGHEITTRSCFRSYGTNCGRLCYPTGTSDHHTGYTCDLVDDAYGDSLDTDTYVSHLDWQWLHENSYKYGFIDRFVSAWAGGSMSEPVNVDENGSTGLYETWHYRYVGVQAATEIATGKYNNGAYDSLEHYLKSAGYLKNLLSPSLNCQ